MGEGLQRAFQAARDTQKRQVCGFLLERMPWEKAWTMRVHLPGIDGGAAFQLESEFSRPTKQEAEAFVETVCDALRIGFERN